MKPNERDLFKDAKDWQRCIDSGESQQGVAERTGYSKTEVSLTLKVGRLPTAEKKRLEAMYQGNRITSAAVEELARLQQMRPRVLERAIEICRAKDKRVKTEIRSAGQKGRARAMGKVTIDDDDVRLAKKELKCTA